MYLSQEQFEELYVGLVHIDDDWLEDIDFTIENGMKEYNIEFYIDECVRNIH